VEYDVKMFLAGCFLIQEEDFHCLLLGLV